VVINRLFDNLPLCQRHDYYPNFFDNLPKNYFFYIDNLCDPKKKIQKRKPTQQVFKKKSNNQPTLVINHGTRLVAAGSPKAS
jgi:hypothetical protein